MWMEIRGACRERFIYTKFYYNDNYLEQIEEKQLELKNMSQVIDI